MSSPHKSILVSTRRRAHAPVHVCVAAQIACLLLLAFAAPVEARAIRGEDMRRAEKVLSQLRLLHEAAGANDAVAYRKLTSKLYPDLFVKVSEMRPSDLSTDLSTAVFLAEKLGRGWAAAGAAEAVCEGERPDIYLPLCLELRGGAVRELLLAKSRLHARWAEASLRNGRGETDAEIARTLAEIEAARANDLLVAALVVKELKNVSESFPGSETSASRSERLDARAPGSDPPRAECAESLRISAALLAWLPRSQTFYRLTDARLAYADGLSWHQRVRQSKSLVVSATSGFAPDPLQELRLDAEQVGHIARANWQTAIKYTRLAQQSLSRTTR